MNDDNENKIPFKSPKESKGPEAKPATEEDYGLEINSRPSKDMTRAELCEIILKMRGEFDGMEKKYITERLRAQIIREEMIGLIQNKIETMVNETIGRVLAGLGVKIGK